jgi:hypothetical protein
MKFFEKKDIDNLFPKFVYSAAVPNRIWGTEKFGRNNIHFFYISAKEFSAGKWKYSFIKFKSLFLLKGL